jgi:GIY-YIG catalytic domain
VAVIYQIINTETGESYIGSTLGYPFGRWSEHVSLLDSGKHHSERFQAAWYSSRPEDWEFKVLESGIGIDFRFAREQAWYEQLHPVLNMSSRITRMVDRRKAEERATVMLSEGKTYRTIAKEIGCSLGWLTAFKRRLSDVNRKTPEYAVP